MRFLSFCIFSLLTAAPYVTAENPSVDIELLQEAWKIPTGGSRAKPYYRITVDGITFPGERSWEDRWALIKDITDYRGSKILELGCNVSLASTYLLKYRDARSAVGVDRPDDLLAQNDMPQMIKAARLIQKAFGVSVDLVQMDMNQTRYEEILGQDFDVAFAMSILKWIDDKERFLDYLANFKKVIYEGHDSDEIEIERFVKRGYQYTVLGKTHVGVSYPLEQTRTLIYFFKD